MSHVDYYQCDGCGQKGGDKFTHVESYGHNPLSEGIGGIDLCRDCASDLKTWLSLRGKR